MNEKHTYIQDIGALVENAAPESIVSRTVFDHEARKVIIFAFAPGQELSEHTASRPAILHFLEGEADLKLGDVEQHASAGSWAHMEAHLPHSIKARSEVKMLLLLL